jgi:hypothetical protein
VEIRQKRIAKYGLRKRGWIAALSKGRGHAVLDILGVLTDNRSGSRKRRRYHGRVELVGSRVEIIDT